MTSCKSILVTNLPTLKGSALLRDKLEIHFSKRSNGGGDVDSIEMGRLAGTRTRAVVTFAEEKTVSAVLMKQHEFFGTRLIIKPHPRPTLDAVTGDRRTTDKKMTITTASNNLSEAVLSRKHKVKLVVNKAYSHALLASVANATQTELDIDDKRAKFALSGLVSDVVQAAFELTRLKDGLKSHDTGQDGRLIPQDEKFRNIAKIPKLKPASLVESVCDDEENFRLTKRKAVCDKKMSVPNSKLQKSKTTNTKNQLVKNLVKFDPKVLDYVNLHVANHKTIQEIQDKFRVYFERKPNGVVEVTPRVPHTSQQNIMDAIGALEGLVNKTEQLDLVTEIVDLRLFHKASLETLDAAVKQVLASTQVVVTRKTWNKLTLFGTQFEVDEVIARLRESALSEQSSDNEDDMEIDEVLGRVENQNTTEESNIHAGNSHLNKEDSTSSGLAQELTDPPLAFAFKDLKHIAGSNNFVQAETVLTPRKPEQSYFDPAAFAFDNSDEIDASVQNLSLDPALRNDDQLMSTLVYIPPVAHNVDAETAAEYRSVDEKLFSDSVENPTLDQVLEDDYQLEQVSQRRTSPVSFLYIPPYTDGANAAAEGISEHRIIFSDEFVENSTLGPVLGDANLDAYAGMVPGFRMRMDPKNPCHEVMQDECKVIVLPDTGLNLFDDVWGETLANRPPSERCDINTSGSSFAEDVTDTGEPSVLYQNPFRTRSCRRSFNQDDFAVTLKTGTTLTIRCGNITNEFTDVIVASSDPRLRQREGIGRAVRDAGGPDLVSACQRWVQRHGPVQEGKSVWTTGGNLSCSHVLHAVLPREKLSGSSNLEVLKEFYVDILKTCTHKLEASRISMPAIGAGGLASKKECALAFCDAVLEMTQLHGDGFVLLDRLALVDTNRATVAQFQEVFTEAILSGYLQQFVNLEDEGSDNDTSEYASAGVHHNRPNNYKHRIRTSNRQFQPAHVPEFDTEECSLPPLPENQCPICRSDIKDVKELKCGHKFCRACVDTATKYREHCPHCRAPL